MSEARYLVGDVFDRMAELSDGSVDLIVTSPPFLALRSYLPADHPDKHKEIGSEATPADFLSTLLALTREWRRVLAPHGSLCVELGDTYSGSGGAGGDYAADGLREGQPKFRQGTPRWDGRPAGQIRTTTSDPVSYPPRGPTGWPLPKSLCLLPTLYPASLAYGRNLLTGEPCEPWRIRNQIVWHRPNPPVGALGDKVRPSTSYITVACTSKTRWFDLDAERSPVSANTHARTAQGVESLERAGKSADRGGNWSTLPELGETAGAPPLDCWHDTSIDDVWTIPTQPYKGSHYATFPITLPRKLINLMCPRQVCRECGEPRRRITGVEYEPHGVKNPNEKRLVTADALTNPSAQGMANGRATKNVETLGWTDCDCPCDCYPYHDSERTNCAKWRRGVVCDPFAGSGTTLVAASELGRDSIGIDLDERNHELARERCGMFLVDEPAEAAS